MRYQNCINKKKHTRRSALNVLVISKSISRIIKLKLVENNYSSILSTYFWRRTLLFFLCRRLSFLQRWLEALPIFQRSSASLRKSRRPSLLLFFLRLRLSFCRRWPEALPIFWRSSTSLRKSTQPSLLLFFLRQRLSFLQRWPEAHHCWLWPKNSVDKSEING